MRSVVLLCALCLLLPACASTAKHRQVRIDPTPISPTVATVVLYYPATIKQGPLTAYDIVVDGEPKGTLIAEKPLRFALKPGRHVLKATLMGVRSKATDLRLEAGKVSYFKVRKEYGTFVDTVHVEPSPQITEYSIISHRP